MVTRGEGRGGGSKNTFGKKLRGSRGLGSRGKRKLLKLYILTVLNQPQDQTNLKIHNEYAWSCPTVKGPVIVCSLIFWDETIPSWKILKMCTSHCTNNKYTFHLSKCPRLNTTGINFVWGPRVVCGTDPDVLNDTNNPCHVARLPKS